MKIQTKLILIASLFLIFSCAEKEIIQYDLIIRNVNLIDGSRAGIKKSVNVYVNNGLIVKIDSAEIQKENGLIEGKGKYLIPGLFDCHIHTTNYKEDFAKLIHYGVTSVFIPGGSLCSNEFYAELRAIGNQDSIPAPRVFHTSQHLTMEGRHPVKTYASDSWREGISVFYLRDTTQIAEIVEEVSKYPIQGIKLTIEDGPAPPFVERIPQKFINKVVSEAAKYDLEVFAHVSDNEEFLMAVNGGAQNLIHFVGIDIEWENEEHLSAVNTLLEKEASIVTTLMIDKFLIAPLHPEWLENRKLNEAYPLNEIKAFINPESIARAKNIEAQTKLEYAIDTLTMENLFNSKVQDIQKLMDKGMNMVLGTDAAGGLNFHGYSLHEEMQILQNGGLSPLDIIKMGTLNAAKMMNAEDSLGSISVGKKADLVLLNKNPLVSISNTLEISMVFKNGKIQKVN